MATSPPRHLRLKAAICALDVVAAGIMGFAAFLSLGALSSSPSDSSPFGDTGRIRSGSSGGAILAALLCVGALAGMGFAIEMWCARSWMTPGKNAVYFFLAALVVVIVAALGEVEAFIALPAVVPPLVGCGLSLYYRVLLKREHPSRMNAEATLMAELITADNSGTWYRRGVLGFLRADHPTLAISHTEQAEPATQTHKAPRSPAERV